MACSKISRRRLFAFVSSSSIPAALTSSRADVPPTSYIPTQTAIGALLYPRTTAESTADVTPTNYCYSAGNVLRYGTNEKPGV
jgi:hypothetical protein